MRPRINVLSLKNVLTCKVVFDAIVTMDSKKVTTDVLTWTSADQSVLKKHRGSVTDVIHVIHNQPVQMKLEPTFVNV